MAGHPHAHVAGAPTHQTQPTHADTHAACATVWLLPQPPRLARRHTSPLGHVGRWAVAASGAACRRWALLAFNVCITFRQLAPGPWESPKIGRHRGCDSKAAGVVWSLCISAQHGDDGERYRRRNETESDVQWQKATPLRNA